MLRQVFDKSNKMVTRRMNMLRKSIVIASVILLSGLYVQSVEAGCKGCDKIAKGKDGFCCGKGKAFGVEIKSKKLHAALAGHKITKEDAAKSTCKGCKKAIAEHGRCEHCNVIAGQWYRSPVSYALAKGTPVTKELIAACPDRCEHCKSAFNGNTKCDKCNVGFVAGRMFSDDKEYKAALAAFEILTKAAKAATKCVECAVALVTDGKCDGCNVSFKDGKIASSKG